MTLFLFFVIHYFLHRETVVLPRYVCLKKDLFPDVFSTPFPPRSLTSDTLGKFFMLFLPSGNTIPQNTQIYCLKYLNSSADAVLLSEKTTCSLVCVLRYSLPEVQCVLIPLINSTCYFFH